MYDAGHALSRRVRLAESPDAARSPDSGYPGRLRGDATSEVEVWAGPGQIDPDVSSSTQSVVELQVL